MRYLIAADTGGTFTDLAVHDTQTNETRYGKTLTNYDDLVAGVVEGLADTGAAVAEARLLKHGTTHVINILLQRHGARTALVTTCGFRDVLEIGRGNRSIPFDLNYRRQPLLVPRDLRLEVDERIDGSGAIVTPLDMAGLAALVPLLRDAGAEAIAVSFLNAYRNPVHEFAARDFLRRELPGVFVTAGCEATREWSEYERTSTACANAFVGAQMANYIGDFGERLALQDFGGQLYMMASGGGVMSTNQALGQPIAMVESGPVGGCIGACAYAGALGMGRMIAFDMGGTTAKCALIEDGRFEVQSSYFVGGYDYGFPIRTPVLDIVEVGAGGGSIAWIDDNGRMKVGPRSAGSDPGPVAFGRGGGEPTVTDANVVLGRIGSDSFLNGRLSLDRAAAAAAIEHRLGDRLGFPGPAGVDHLAQGILDIATVTMTSAIKEVSTERGRDVRDYDLFVFGGGGPMFAVDLARSLGIRRVVVPPNPGAFSSFGMLMAEARQDASRTFLQPVDDAAPPLMGEAFAAMEEELREGMAGQFDIARLAFDYEADMRYRGQSHTVRVRFAMPASVADIAAAFDATYRKRYGHANPVFPVEFLTLHLIGRVPTARPELSGAAAVGGESVPHGRRPVYFRTAQRRVETPVYRRDDLAVGQALSGPAVIEEYSATTIIGIGDSLSVGAFGELRISCAAVQDLPAGTA